MDSRNSTILGNDPLPVYATPGTYNIYAIARLDPAYSFDGGQITLPAEGPSPSVVLDASANGWETVHVNLTDMASLNPCLNISLFDGSCIPVADGQEITWVGINEQTLIPMLKYYQTSGADTWNYTTNAADPMTFDLNDHDINTLSFGHTLSIDVDTTEAPLEFGETGKFWLKILDQYNNGYIGPGHCSE